MKGPREHDYRGLNIILMVKDTNSTSDHDEIQQWIEDREGVPAMVRTEGSGEGMLRVDFGDSEENLMEISWAEFFRLFDEQALAFVYESEGEDGEISMFYALVPRDGGEDEPIAGFGGDDEDDEDDDEDGLPEGFGEEDNY